MACCRPVVVEWSRLNEVKIKQREVDGEEDEDDEALNMHPSIPSTVRFRVLTYHFLLLLLVVLLLLLLLFVCLACCLFFTSFLVVEERVGKHVSSSNWFPTSHSHHHVDHDDDHPQRTLPDSQTDKQTDVEIPDPSQVFMRCQGSFVVVLGVLFFFYWPSLLSLSFAPSPPLSEKLR